MILQAPINGNKLRISVIQLRGLVLMLLLIATIANAKTANNHLQQVDKYYFAFDSSQIFAKDKPRLSEIPS